MYLQQSAGTVSSSYFIMFTGLIKDMHHCAFKSYQFQFTFIFIAGFLFSKALWRLKKQPYVIKNKTWPAVPIRASQKNAITGIQIYKMKFTLITLLNCPLLVLLSESKTSWLTSKRIQWYWRLYDIVRQYMEERTTMTNYHYKLTDRNTALL